MEPFDCHQSKPRLFTGAPDTGQTVSPGFVDRANALLAEALTGAGFDEALLAALLGETG